MLKLLLFTNSALSLCSVSVSVPEQQIPTNESNVKQSTSGEKEQPTNRCQVCTKGGKLHGPGGTTRSGPALSARPGAASTQPEG